MWWAAGPLAAAAGSVGPEDAWPILGMAAAVALALVLSAELFGLTLRLFPHDPRVSRLLMLRLVAVSALLNYLPLPRAGAWGRAAYLKTRHGFALGSSLVSLALVLAVSVSVYAVVSGTLLLTEGDGRLNRLAYAASGVAGLCLVSALLPVAGGWTRVIAPGRLWAWPLLRVGDLLLAAVRLVLACHVVGVELSLANALLLASGGLLTRLVGLTPNGLGLSEATIAALAAALTPLESSVVAAAALVDRGVEAAVVAVAAAASRPGQLLAGTHASEA